MTASKSMIKDYLNERARRIHPDAPRRRNSDFPDERDPHEDGSFVGNPRRRNSGHRKPPGGTSGKWQYIQYLDDHGLTEEEYLEFLREVFEKVKLPNEFYHVTTDRNVESILEKGIISSGSSSGNVGYWLKDKVFLANSSQAIESSGLVTQYSVAIIVDSSKLNKSRMQLDPEHYTEHFVSDESPNKVANKLSSGRYELHVAYDSNVSPSAIKKVVRIDLDGRILGDYVDEFD